MVEHESKDRLAYRMLAVNKKPYCVWNWNLRENNLRFIDGIDHEYFEYLARVHAAVLDPTLLQKPIARQLGRALRTAIDWFARKIGKKRQREPSQHEHRAALSLRTAYYHGLETFFTLLCAALQAPASVAPWILKCRTSDLLSLVREIQSGRGTILNAHGLKQVSWQIMSERINLVSYEEEDKVKDTRQLFAELWGYLAHDFLDPYHRAEYNSIKHGLRVSPGGFTLAVGIEEQYGVPAPPEAMQVIGRSEFGTSYFATEPIRGAPRQKKADPHISLKQQSVNWAPEAMILSLQLISISIHNIISALRIWHGVEPKTVPFLRPVDRDAFLAPWRQSGGVMQMSFGLPIEEAEIRRFSDDEIRDALEQESGWKGDGSA